MQSLELICSHKISPKPRGNNLTSYVLKDMRHSSLSHTHTLSGPLSATSIATGYVQHALPTYSGPTAAHNASFVHLPSRCDGWRGGKGAAVKAVTAMKCAPQRLGVWGAVCLAIWEIKRWSSRMPDILPSAISPQAHVL